MKKIKENFKKNFPTGIVALIIMVVVYILLKFIINPIKEILTPLYKLIPLPIKTGILNDLAFILFGLISLILFVWFLGNMISYEYKGKSLARFFDQLPFINFIWRTFDRFKTVVIALLKYNMVVRWEPTPKVALYGVVTNKVKIVKKNSSGKIQIKNKFFIYVGTVPMILSGNIIEPDPQDLWLVMNLSFKQLLRLVTTAGGDVPEKLELEPVLKHYPNFEIEKLEIENQKNKTQEPD